MPEKSYSLQCADDDWWSPETLRILHACLPDAVIIDDRHPRNVIVVEGAYSLTDIQLVLIAAMGPRNGVRIFEQEIGAGGASSAVLARINRLHPNGGQVW